MISAPTIDNLHFTTYKNPASAPDVTEHCTVSVVFLPRKNQEPETSVYVPSETTAPPLQHEQSPFLSLILLRFSTVHLTSYPQRKKSTAISIA